MEASIKGEYSSSTNDKHIMDQKIYVNLSHWKLSRKIE